MTDNASSLGNVLFTRYPDPRVEVVDKRFMYKLGNASIEKITTGYRWAEGLVYFRDGRDLLWSDLPNKKESIKASSIRLGGPPCRTASVHPVRVSLADLT